MTLALLSAFGAVAELADAFALRVNSRKGVRVQPPAALRFSNHTEHTLSVARGILVAIPSLPQLTGWAAQRVSRSLPGAVPAAAGNHRTGAVNEADQETNSSGQDHPSGATQAGGRGPGRGVRAGVAADPAEAGVGQEPNRGLLPKRTAFDRLALWPQQRLHQHPLSAASRLISLVGCALRQDEIAVDSASRVVGVAPEWFAHQNRDRAARRARTIRRPMHVSGQLTERSQPRARANALHVTLFARCSYARTSK
jgi:hypothetical protein